MMASLFCFSFIISILAVFIQLVRRGGVLIFLVTFFIKGKSDKRMIEIVSN
jgi:hypothetical protein